MAPPSHMLSVVDRNVVMQRMTVQTSINLKVNNMNDLLYK